MCSYGIKKLTVIYIFPCNNKSCYYSFRLAMMINSYQINVLIIITQIEIYKDFSVVWRKKAASGPNFKTMLFFMFCFFLSSNP